MKQNTVVKNNNISIDNVHLGGGFDFSVVYSHAALLKSYHFHDF